MAYELKEETLNKLGLNKDGTEKEGSETPSTPEGLDEHGNEIRSYSDAEIGINIGNDFLNPPKADTEEKKPEKKPESEEANPEEGHPSKQTATEEKTGEESPKKGHPSSQEEEETKEPTFQDRVIEKLKSFEDEEAQSKFMKDLENYEKFHATNTQTQMKLADERKQFQQLVNELVGEDYQKVIDEILKLDDLKDFLESGDEWYSEREEGNPFRKLIDVWRAKNDNVKQYHEQTSAFEKEKSELTLEKEVFAVQKLDDRYKDTETLIALGDLADQHGVDLKTAHKLWLADNLLTNVTDLNDKIKALEKDKTNLKKELKARNEEVTELKSKQLPPSPGVLEPIGAESFDYTTPSSGFDETEQRLRQKLGVTA